LAFANAGYRASIVLNHEREAFSLEYRRLAEAIPAMIWLANADGETIYANRRWFDFTGVEIVGTGPGFISEALVHPGDRARLLAAWMESSDGSAPIEVEYRLRANEGGYRWVMARAIPLRDENGVVQQWLGAAVDIDAQKIAAEYLREMMEAMPQIVFTSAANGGVDYYNRRWYDVTGQSEDAAIGEGWQLVIHPDDLPALAETVGAAKHDGRPYRAEYRLRAADGTYRWHVVTARPVIDTNGDVAKWVGVATDIDDQKRLYERERRIAHTFQQAALPRTLPEVAGASLSAMYHPAESEGEVGGDWYDAFLIEDHTLVLSMGDVAGKGLEAAVVMGVVRQAIRVAALESEECTRVIAAADRALQMEYASHVVTAIVMFIDLQTMHCRFVNAGHPSPLLREPDGTIVALRETNPPLGVLAARFDCVGFLELRKDSLLALYTDGLTEATRDMIEGEERVFTALGASAMLHTPNPARLLYDTVLDREPRDDVAILVVSFGRARRWSFDARDAEQAQGARVSFIRHLYEQAEGSSDFGAAELIFGELVGNVVRYAPGPIDIDLEWSGEAPVLHVLDRGTSFSFDPTRIPDPLSENGRGLYIVRMLGTDLRVRPLPNRGNHVSIQLPVRRRIAD
jgi:PAS domain S-box-containing protein